MARYTGPRCRLCRTENKRLFLKGDKCKSDKCPVNRKRMAPGKDPKTRQKKQSEYAVQMREKQKIKFSYGVTDRQLKKVFKNAAGTKGTSAIDVITKLLEGRLDNVIMRLGFAPSRSISRQMVNHGHFSVNGWRVKTPSYQVRPGDVITIYVPSRNNAVFEGMQEKLKSYNVPSWLSLNKETLEGKVESEPKDVDFQFNINLVVDYYSKK